MFPKNYFASRYFAPRYWPPSVFEQIRNVVCTFYRGAVQRVFKYRG